MTRSLGHRVWGRTVLFVLLLVPLFGLFGLCLRLGRRRCPPRWRSTGYHSPAQTTTRTVLTSVTSTPMHTRTGRAGPTKMSLRAVPRRRSIEVTRWGATLILTLEDRRSGRSSGAGRTIGTRGFRRGRLRSLVSLNGFGSFRRCRKVIPYWRCGLWERRTPRHLRKVAIRNVVQEIGHGLSHLIQLFDHVDMQ